MENPVAAAERYHARKSPYSLWLDKLHEEGRRDGDPELTKETFTAGFEAGVRIASALSASGSPPPPEDLAKVIYDACPTATASGHRLLSWEEVQTLTGYPYPIITEGHQKEARAVHAFLLQRQQAAAAAAGSDVDEAAVDRAHRETGIPRGTIRAAYRAMIDPVIVAATESET